MLIAMLGSLAPNDFLSKLHDAAGDGFADAGYLTALAVGRDKRSAGALMVDLAALSFRISASPAGKPEFWSVLPADT